MTDAARNAKAWFESIEDMLDALETTDDTKREEAEQRIHESVLSVLIRDAWHEPGQGPEDGPDEYEILLSTGGPALRIWGKLDENCEPHSAELQMQDWGTPWTRYAVPEHKLLHFAQQFWFGE